MDFFTSRLNKLISNVTSSMDTTVLHWAVKCKNKNEILKVLSNVCPEDLKVPDQYGNTVLHLILANKNLAKNEIIELLGMFLDQGVDIYKENKRGKTVLHRAIQCRMKSVVDFLIRREVDINKRDNEGNSVTHKFIADETKWFYESLERRKSRFHRIDSLVVGSYREAQENESASFTEFLIERGFDFDLRNNSGISALHLAGKRNLLHILHVLVKHTRDIHFLDCKKRSLLQLIIETRAACRDARKHLTRDWYPKYASRYTTKILRILLDRGVSTWPHDNDRHCSSLQTAVEYQEDESIVNMLIDHGLKSMENCSVTEMFAELFKIYLRCGVLKTGYFSTRLCDLIKRGADVNAKDKSGTTPLYHAFHQQNTWAARFLINYQADFSTTTDSNENLFHALARVVPTDRKDREKEGIELLTLFHLAVNEGCCNVNARNHDNETPLHLAARSENLAIACKLIDLGAEVNCKDVNGRTPLDYAVYHGKFERMIELLLKEEAHVNDKDEKGRRPLSIAADLTKANEVVPGLLKRGAYVNVGEVADLPFWKCIANGKHRIAEDMLAYGADINNNDAVVRSILERPRGCHEPSWRDCETFRKRLFLLRHWIKLSAAKLPCSKEYEAHVKTAECQEVYEECLKEIEKLKYTFIDDRVSIYRFLHMDFGRRQSHVKSEKLRQLVQSPRLEKQFPNYSVVILASYRETVLWKSLLEPAKFAWFKVTDIRLPGECVEPIIAHLRIQDLVNMIDFDEDV